MRRSVAEHELVLFGPDVTKEQGVMATRVAIQLNTAFNFHSAHVTRPLLDQGYGYIYIYIYRTIKVIWLIKSR